MGPKKKSKKLLASASKGKNLSKKDKSKGSGNTNKSKEAELNSSLEEDSPLVEQHGSNNPRHYPAVGDDECRARAHRNEVYDSYAAREGDNVPAEEPSRREAHFRITGAQRGASSVVEGRGRGETSQTYSRPREVEDDYPPSSQNRRMEWEVRMSQPRGRETFSQSERGSTNTRGGIGYGRGDPRDETLPKTALYTPSKKKVVRRNIEDTEVTFRTDNRNPSQSEDYQVFQRPSDSGWGRNIGFFAERDDYGKEIRETSWREELGESRDNRRDDWGERRVSQGETSRLTVRESREREESRAPRREERMDSRLEDTALPARREERIEPGREGIALPTRREGRIESQQEDIALPTLLEGRIESGRENITLPTRREGRVESRREEVALPTQREQSSRILRDDRESSQVFFLILVSPM